jgi:hypothetical protein
MNIEQKQIIEKSILFSVIFIVSTIFIYYIFFAQFVPTSYSHTVEYANGTNVTTYVDSATDLYENIFILVSGIIGCALGIISIRIIGIAT